MSLALLLCGVVMVNVVAINQIRGMTQFSNGTERTASPEKLSWFEKIGVIVSGVQLPRPVGVVPGRVFNCLGVILVFIVVFLYIPCTSSYLRHHIKSHTAKSRNSVSGAEP